MKNVVCKIVILLFFTVANVSCFKDKAVDEFTVIPNDTYETFGGRIDFLSQIDLDNFGAEGYRAIIGDVVIENVSDLSSLKDLEEVYGDLYIRECFDLTDLKGLENLSYIEGGLNIQHCGITSIDALSNLNTVFGDLVFQYNHEIEILKGLEGLKNLDKSLEIRFCDNLKSINVARNVVKIKNAIGIRNCTKLTSIGGFDKLTEVDRLYIFQNDILINLNAFNNLNKVESFIQINECPLLEKISGFDVLTEVNEINIYECDTLNEIGAFSKITSLQNLKFLELSSLTTVTNFSSLTTINELLSIQQCGITNIDFLSSLEKLGYSGKDPKLALRMNPFLTDFCGLRNINTPSNIYYDIELNAYNPTLEEIKSEDCK